MWSDDRPQAPARPAGHISPLVSAARRPAALLIALAITCVAGFRLEQGTNRTSSDSAPALHVEDGALDLGEHWQGAVLDWRLPIGNASDVAMEVLGVTSSCGCTTAEPGSFTIEPGSVHELPLTIQMNSAAARFDPEGVAPFRVSITATLRQPSTAIQWQLQGTVKRPATIEPPSPVFAERSRLAPQWEPRILEIRLHRPAKRIEVLFGIANVISEILDFDAASQVGHLRIVPEVTAVGAASGTVTIRGWDAAGAEFEVGEVPVTAAITQDVLADPQRAVLGILNLGSSVQRTIVLRSRTADDCSIVHAQCLTDWLTVLSNERVSRGTFELKLACRCENTGFQSADLTILAQSAADGEVEEIVVPVQFIGADPPSGDHPVSVHK